MATATTGLTAADTEFLREALALEATPPRVAHRAVGSLPTSGTPEELMEAAGISAGWIADAARSLLEEGGVR